MPKAETSRAEIPVAEHIKRFSPEIQRLIREVRTVVKKVAPKAEEKAYRGWPIRIRTEHGLVAIMGFDDREHGQGRTLEGPEEAPGGDGQVDPPREGAHRRGREEPAPPSPDRAGAHPRAMSAPTKGTDGQIAVSAYAEVTSRR